MIPEDQNLLLKLARDAIDAFLREGKTITSSQSLYQDSYFLKNKIKQEFQENAACFVTLNNKNGDLRGCIGTTLANTPLYQNIINYAILAATEDDRFRPLTLKELEHDTLIEISALGPLSSAKSSTDFMLGQDGLVMQYRNNQALFLPQVATEHNLSKEEFLYHLAEKAGIHSSHINKATYQKFIVTKFSETIN